MIFFGSMMKQIPQEFLKQFESQLLSKGISPAEYPEFKKWMRYYIDFCSKYGHAAKNTYSLPLFINKLREKKQTRQQQKQAYDSILIYYDMYGIVPHWYQKPVTGNSPENAIHEDTSAFEKPLKASVQDGWNTVYSRLSNEIKVRHYSPKTFDAYCKWVQQFQTFVRNKALDSLSPDDVKQFLTWLAVEQKCSASAQNQAFNGLLFFSGIFLERSPGKLTGWCGPRGNLTFRLYCPEKKLILSWRKSPTPGQL
ncbi:site-specific integrase [uncultured Desulfobacter sp.]|uniref:site-specific integrase n=1 Tax=uncultured Desulfobacter sp. TaxID=240139 RepID=UPI002AAABD75|nr:site-specific integrase [uncultured Desulfobacter sp.]